LEGKVAFVTGASGGIGGAITKAMHMAGATVVINGRNIDKLNALRKYVENQATIKTQDSAADHSCGKVFSVLLSLMDIDVPKQLIKQSVEMTEHNIDILVNAAGIHGLKQFHKITPGIFCDITSAATHGAPGQAHYNASKAALEGLTKSLASNPNYVRHAVTINSITPGIIDTNMMKPLRGEAKKRNLSIIPRWEDSVPRKRLRLQPYFWPFLRQNI
jgi:3-oxoacyl-[acyl-carrier protein] reductase